MAAPESTNLKQNALGAPSLVYIVIATIAPLAACAANIPLIIGHGNGIAAPADFLLIGCVLLLFAAGYTAMSEHMVHAGAFYAYVTMGLGDRFGTAAGYLALASYNILTICTSAMGGYIISRNLGFELGVDIPWWAASLVVWVLVWFVGYLGIDVGAHFMGVCLVLELTIILAVIGSVLLTDGTAAFPSESFSVETFMSGSPGLGLVFAFACYLGFEATADYGEEARCPHRTVPLATCAALVVVGILFMGCAWAMIAALGSQHVITAAQGEDAGTILYRIVETRTGAIFGHIYNWFYLLSSIACWVSAHNAATRYIYAFGRAGLLPCSLARTHRTRKSPYVAGCVQALFGVCALSVMACLGFSPYAQIGATASALACIGIMLLELLTSLAAVRYLQRHAHESGFNYSVLRRLVAPMASAVLLSCVVVLVMGNLSALTEQESPLVNAILAICMPTIFVIGLWNAQRLQMAGKLPSPLVIMTKGSVRHG